MVAPFRKCFHSRTLLGVTGSRQTSPNLNSNIQITDTRLECLFVFWEMNVAWLTILTLETCDSDTTTTDERRTTGRWSNFPQESELTKKKRAHHRKRCVLTRLITFAVHFCCGMSFAVHSKNLFCHSEPICVELHATQQHSTGKEVRLAQQDRHQVAHEV